MATTPPGIPSGEITQLVSAVRELHVATLTAAIVSSAGRPHSIKEVLEIQRDIFLSQYAGMGRGGSEEALLSKVHD